MTIRELSLTRLLLSLLLGDWALVVEQVKTAMKKKAKARDIQFLLLRAACGKTARVYTEK
jgi:hypothetical protein